MRVFISWSGERSRELANALRDWLPLVLHYVEPWLSEADIEAGDRWAQSVAQELAAANFGIVCVTPENANAPWVLFEAGALAKSLHTSKVIPLLLDLEFSDISGPLAQFQAKKASKEGLHEIVRSIQSTADASVPDQRAAQLFDALWPQLEEKITGIPKELPTQRHVRSQHEVLEELVASIRAIEARSLRSDEAIANLVPTRRELATVAELRDRLAMLPSLEDSFSAALSRLDASLAQLARVRDSNSGPHWDPRTIGQIADQLSPEADNPTKLLILTSVLRPQMPWLYDMSLEIYTARIDKRDPRGALRALRAVLERSVNESIPLKLDIEPTSFNYVVAQMNSIVIRMLERPRNQVESDN